MRGLRCFLGSVSLLVFSMSLGAQSRIYGDRFQQSGTTLDATLATHTRPFSTQSALPAACSTNDWMYTPGVGLNMGTLSVCIAPNAWRTFTSGSSSTSTNATSLNGTPITSYTGILKLASGVLSPIQTADVTSLFTGVGTYLRADGTLGTPAPAGLTAPGSNGLLKYTGSNATTVASGGDIVSLFGSGSCAGFLKSDLTCGTVTGGGTLTNLTIPATPTWLTASVANATTTPAITLSATAIAANLVLAGPASGASAALAPRPLVATDIPSLDATKITTGTITSARLPLPGASAAGVVFTQACNPGQHLNAIANTGVASCSADTGGSALVPATTSPLAGDGSGGVIAATSTSLVGLFSGTTGALCADGTRGTCGISGSANISSGADSTARPTYSAGAFFIDHSKNPAQRPTYYDPLSSAWYTTGLFSGNFTQDASTGQTDLNTNNVPLLTTANTFGTGLQTIPHLKVGVDCVQPDGATPCFGAGSNVVAIQQNSTGQGNAATLNFGSGLTATTSSGVTTIVNSGLRSLNGSTTPDQSFLTELATDVNGWLTVTAHSVTGTAFHIYNSQSASGGIHNWGIFADTGGNLGVYDDSSGGFSGGWRSADHAVLSGGGFQSTVRTVSALPACDSTHDGQFAAVNDSTVNTWGTTVAGGGGNHVGVYCDSVSWTVMSK